MNIRVGSQIAQRQLGTWEILTVTKFERNPANTDRTKIWFDNGTFAFAYQAKRFFKSDSWRLEKY